MKDLRLAVKIGVGFGLILAIACALGLMAVFQMGKAEESSSRMKDEYVPEVMLANDLERHALLTMYGMRGFVYSGKTSYIDESRKNMAEVEKALVGAKALVEKFPRLVKLRESLDTARTRFAEYEKLAEETKTRLGQQAKDRVERIRAAADVLAQAEQYLSSQDVSLREEIERDVPNKVLVERYEKIKLMTFIVQSVADARIKILSGDANDDLALYTAALGLFPAIESGLAKIRLTTVKAENLKRLDALETGLATYKRLVGRQIENTQAVQTLNEKRGKVAQDVLDAAEGIATEGMGQVAKLAADSDEGLTASGRLLLGGLAVALALGATVAVLITRAITGPVRRGVDFARTVAGGD
ncbi:CHASE3 domain-containing protein, partial [Fundidesulfovibrio magnetotacticus]|uniref:CHASE3 domain-containing protein n=1 Tax=Fundidesulfovibrio magnetotacticus TaxID=2730080 RepID=UPI003FCD877C